MKKNRYILIIILIILQAHFVFSQNSSFYIQIDDEKIVPKIETIDNNGHLKFKNRKDKQDTILNKYKIKKFEKAFPTAITPSLKNVYHVICDKEKLGYDL